MEKRNSQGGQRGANAERSEKPNQRMRKKSEYGRQLEEKQKVKRMYGMRERQFRRFYKSALRSEAATGEMLLSILERRLDNVVYRLKFASTREQARQIVVHGHVIVNGRKVSAPAYLVSVNDVVGFSPRLEAKVGFLEQVIEKRLNSNAKVPDWLELDRKARKGNILRLPVRADVQVPVEEHLIVELYSK